MTEPTVPWFRAEVVLADVTPMRQTVEGTASTVAAWLRAVANEIDPPRPQLRSAIPPSPDDETGTHAAVGLRAAIREMPPHRGRNGRGRIGFASPHAEGDQL